MGSNPTPRTSRNWLSEQDSCISVVLDRSLDLTPRTKKSSPVHCCTTQGIEGIVAWTETLSSNKIHYRSSYLKHEKSALRRLILTLPRGISRIRIEFHGEKWSNHDAFQRVLDKRQSRSWSPPVHFQCRLSTSWVSVLPVAKSIVLRVRSSK